MKFGAAFLGIAIGSTAVISFSFTPLVSSHSKSILNDEKSPFFLSLVSEVRLYNHLSASINHPHKGLLTRQVLIVMQDTETETEGMNEQDENILFGAQSNNSDLRRHKSKTGNLLQSTNTQLNHLDHSSSNPLINKLHSMRSTLESCPQIWSELAKSCPEKLALYDDHLCDERVKLTFDEANVAVKKSAAIFQNLGVSKGTNIAILGENSGNWLLVDHGIQLAGGISAVR